MFDKNPQGHHHGKHAGRDDLTGEHRWGDTLQVIFIFSFLAIWILDSFVLNLSTQLGRIIPWYIRISATVLICIPAYLLVSNGIKIVFGQRREKPEVINKGVFSIVRHPIYLGAIMFYLGLIISTFSLLSIAIWIVIIGWYRYISGYEENLLTRRFGDAYIDYKKKVPMLFPLRF